jgi:N-acetylmuramic acid 6-phosphate etherase
VNAPRSESISLAVLRGVPTEVRNPRTTEIDVLPTLDMLRLINAEDARVPGAVEKALPQVAKAVEFEVEALRGGGRVHYFGAGTSGRLAVLDAAELPPTFGIDPGLVVAHHAGGLSAISQAIEDVEDDAALGAHDAAEVTARDVAVGVTASGRTPYVVSALRTAAAAGARTVLISSNPAAAAGAEVDVHIAVDTGPEAVSGSTRMKAGTAAKLVLNAMSTAAMVRLGRTYSNLMVSMSALNSKLRGRLVKILVEATGMDAETCATALADAAGDTRTALVSLLCDVSPGRAAEALAASGGSVREAMRTFRGDS